MHETDDRDGGDDGDASREVCDVPSCARDAAVRVEELQATPPGLGGYTSALCPNHHLHQATASYNSDHAIHGPSVSTSVATMSVILSDGAAQESSIHTQKLTVRQLARMSNEELVEYYLRSGALAAVATWRSEFESGTTHDYGNE